MIPLCTCTSSQVLSMPLPHNCGNNNVQRFKSAQIILIKCCLMYHQPLFTTVNTVFVNTTGSSLVGNVTETYTICPQDWCNMSKDQHASSLSKGQGFTIFTSTPILHLCQSKVNLPEEMSPLTVSLPMHVSYTYICLCIRFSSSHHLS